MAAPALMRDFMLVGIGGAIGAMARYGVSVAAVHAFGTRFPWGTLIVNLAGCFIWGLAFALLTHELQWSVEARLFLITGFLGGLTTFSSFGGETVLLAVEGSGAVAILNVAANNVAGIGLAALGLWLGRLF